MTKTIKELAECYAYTNWESDDYHEGAADGLPFDAIGHTEKSFEAGANAVLNELEEFVNSASFGDKIGGILSFIKELRSE